MKGIILGCIASMYALATSLMAHAQDEEKKTLLIGVIAPLTLGNAQFGADIKNATEIVAARFNSNGNARHTYKIIVEDGKCGSGNAATSAANKLIKIDKVAALVVGCSGEILQIAETIEKNKIPTMVVFASHPKVKHLGPHIFRVFMDLDNDIPKIAKKIQSDNRTRTAIITEELPFTMGIKDVLTQVLGQAVVASPDYIEGSNDFRSLLLRIKGANPDSLFLNAASVETLGPMVKQIAELKLDLPLYSFAYPSVPTFIKDYAQFAEGITFLSPPGLAEATEIGKQLKNLFVTHTRAAPNAPFVAATAFDGATALMSALEQSSHGEPKTTLDSLNHYTAQGVLGNISFDANGDAVGISYQLATIRDGKMELLH